MPLATPERLVSVKVIEGINRLENQRIDDPQAPFSTVNLFARQPDLLAKRPGTKLVIDGRTVANTIVVSATKQPAATLSSNLGAGEVASPSITPKQYLNTITSVKVK